MQRQPGHEPRRIMMIGAHPDDCDFRCGGIAIKYARMGYQVQFLSVSDGSSGHQSMQPAALAGRRKKEAAEAARVAGISYLVLDNPDGEITADLQTRRQLIRLIRQFRPDLVLTSRTNDYHADHRNTGLLVQDASYLLIVPNICPEIEPVADMPVIGFFYDRFSQPAFQADLVIDIDDAIDQKFTMMACHESQVFEWLPYTNHRLQDVPADSLQRLEWLRTPRLDDLTQDGEIRQEKRAGIFGEMRMAEPARLYREQLIARYGREHGSQVRFAEAFQISEYGRQPDPMLLDQLFPF